jgi:hypothetical protein
MMGVYVGAVLQLVVLLILVLLQMLWHNLRLLRVLSLFYTKTGMGDGQQANNLGYKSFRSITRVSWDNYVSNADAKKYELSRNCC